MFSTNFISAALASAVLFQQSAALGINCRGSGLCPLAGFESDGSEGILQGLRDAMYSVDNATVPGSTLYKDGDHVICVSSSIKISISVGVSADGVHGDVGLNGKLGIGGVCAFAQNTGSAGITLDRARQLMDGLLEHGCKVCGSNPTQSGNNVKNGQLTVNYVKNPDCVGNCLGAGAGLNPTAGKDQTSSAPAQPASSALAAPSSSAAPSSPASVPASTTSAAPTSATSDDSASETDSSETATDSDSLTATTGANSGKVAATTESDKIAATTESSRPTSSGHAVVSSTARHGNATTFSTHTRPAGTTNAPESGDQKSYTVVPYIAYTTVML